jgi:hypothetical protein
MGGSLDRSCAVNHVAVAVVGALVGPTCGASTGVTDHDRSVNDPSILIPVQS